MEFRAYRWKTEVWIESMKRIIIILCEVRFIAVCRVYETAEMKSFDLCV